MVFKTSGIIVLLIAGYLSGTAIVEGTKKLIEKGKENRETRKDK